MPWQLCHAKWPVLRTTAERAPTATTPPHWRNREKQLLHPVEAVNLPCFLLAFSPSKWQPIISPLKPCPGFVGGTSAEVPLSAEPWATTRIPPVLHVPFCTHRHSRQSRSHVSGLTIPPDAGKEKLKKASWRNDIKKELSRCSWGS